MKTSCVASMYVSRSLNNYHGDVQADDMGHGVHYLQHDYTHKNILNALAPTLRTT